MTVHPIGRPSANTTNELEGRGSRRAGAIRYVLGALLAFGALNAFAGGYYGLIGAKGLPTEWLRGSPFRDYFVPSLILFVIVGGSFLAAALAVFARWRHGRRVAIFAGMIVLGWLAIEVAIIGYVSWLQPASAIGGALVLALAWELPQARPVAHLRRRTT